ncbi:hypothetical protein GCM10009836_52340 [Pseudonocardia ailaonensis]|uniref:DUF1707 domain-containing protein n=1 Tax=Pseudonocardia ailaonensis TaxID=367279 RepID=A0ABN2NI66_9PSEU
MPARTEEALVTLLDPAVPPTRESPQAGEPITPTGDRPPDGTPPAGLRLRCSDTERERTATVLQAAVGDGRLTVDELEERLDRTYRARYRDELAAEVADLPTPDPEPSRGWAGVAEAAFAQLRTEAAILSGFVPADPRRRLLALLILVGPVLVLCAGAALALHGLLDPSSPGPPFGHGRFHGPGPAFPG